MAPARIPLARRFWAKVDRRGPDECWPWTGSTRRKGYGKIRRPGADGGWVSAHHVAWELVHGPVPDGKQVLHRCDNPPCCNERHLFLGDNDANVADKVAKGRQCSGVRNGQAKLDETRVLAIRRRHTAGEGIKPLARAYGVSPRTVQFIVRHQTWAHIG